MITPEEQEERIQEIITLVAEVSDPIPEKVVWDALREAYFRGYQDGVEVRAPEEKKERP